MTKEEILEKARIEMPYHFPDRIKPYMEESMDIYAKQEAIAFKEWCDQGEGAYGYSLGRELTNDELYEYYKNGNFPLS